jgi:pimeloyl-ACP methyl ester carboxylesterase
MKFDFSKKQMDIGTFAFNFVRTLAVAGTGGAELNECLRAASAIKDGDIESWVTQWALLAEEVRAAATKARAAGQTITARQTLLRASNYYRAAMFSLPHTDPRLDAYLRLSRTCFRDAAQLFSPAIEAMDIPFGDARLPAYFLSAGAPGSPTLLVLNGGDSTNEEMVHWIGFAAVARGWNCMVFEGPGQWSAMQLNPGLVLRPDYEAPARAALDALVQRGDVDASRIALFGPSLGALLAARVAAFEPRITACVCDGLVVDVYEAWHAVWPRILQKAPPVVFDIVFGIFERLSPQLRGITNHFRWMLGAAKPHDIIDAWKPYSIKDLAGSIRCPTLLLYGEAEVAQSNDAVTLSAMRFINQLGGPVCIRMFGDEDGWAASHCQVGAFAAMQAVVFDWLERAVNDSGRLPRRDIGSNVKAVIVRYTRDDRARTELRALLGGT